MRQYETFEIRLQGETLSQDWGNADVNAVFVCGGEQTTVRGFYDGNGQYVVRFLPLKAGETSWQITGAVNASGSEMCLPAKDAHGVVRAADTHFAYDDGKLFIPVGTTVYALASQDDDLAEETLHTLADAPFNKVRMCVFPKHYNYNHNEPPFYPFEKNADGTWDVSRPCIAFWHRFESILKRIGAMGIQVDLILFHPYDRWGFASMPQKDNLSYLRYLLARLSAFPHLWWSLANEYDLNMPPKTLHDWEEIEGFVAEQDPYGHLLSCHNCFALWDFARPSVTHCSIQTKALTEIPRWMQTYHKPVVIDECCYEGDLSQAWGSISGREMVNRFWRCYASGAYCTHGETFLNDEEVLWWARGGKLRGESPKRIAFLRQVMESLPGPMTPWMMGWNEMELWSAEEIRQKIASDAVPEGFMRLALHSIARMGDADRIAHLQGGHNWASRCGDEAFLFFFDQQTSAEFPFVLPEGKTYRADVIDTWNMTRQTVLAKACGRVILPLPAREGMAALITRIG